MENSLARKLDSFVVLRPEDKARLREVSQGGRTYPARSTIIRQHDNPENVHLVLQGMACRYKMTDKGRRQIFGYMIAGEFCDLHVALLSEMDHTIATVSESEIVDIPRRTILELTEEHSTIAKALELSTLVDEAILREWLVNVGQRPADQRIAHLFCEMQARLAVVGAGDDKSVPFPVTQLDLADTVGVSVVHVNRSLMALKERNLATFHRGLVEFPDLERLRRFAGFDDGYLHIRRELARKSVDLMPGSKGKD